MTTRLRTNNISHYVMKQEPKRRETENLPAQKQKENERKLPAFKKMKWQVQK